MINSVVSREGSLSFILLFLVLVLCEHVLCSKVAGNDNVTLRSMIGGNGKVEIEGNSQEDSLRLEGKCKEDDCGEEGKNAEGDQLNEKKVKGLSDPSLETDFFFFSSSLSNSEKKNFLLLTSSQEQVFRRVPQIANLDYAIQLAIFALAEGKFVSPRFLTFKISNNKKEVTGNMFKVLDCLYSSSNKTLKLIKLIRQRCFFHNENIELGIIPEKISEIIIERCNEFRNIEYRYARLMDFVYLMRMIVHKSESHNSSLVNLSKIIWSTLKSPKFKNVKFSKDIFLVSSVPEKSLNSKDRSKVSKISKFIGYIDNTLLSKIKILPFWIKKTINEYNMILTSSVEYVKDIWPPFISGINSDIRRVNNCIQLKKSQTPNKHGSFSPKGEELFREMKEISKQIIKDIK